MIVLVTGGRDYTDRDHVFAVLDAIHTATPIARIVHGACGWDADSPASWQTLHMLRGADALADQWSGFARVRVERHPAQWLKLGLAAGPRRNTAMAARLVWLRWNEKRDVLVIAFPGGRGTSNMIAQARGKQLPVRACCEGHAIP